MPCLFVPEIKIGVINKLETNFDQFKRNHLLHNTLSRSKSTAAILFGCHWCADAESPDDESQSDVYFSSQSSDYAASPWKNGDNSHKCKLTIKHEMYKLH